MGKPPLFLLSMYYCNQNHANITAKLFGRLPFLAIDVQIHYFESYSKRKLWL